MSRSSREDVSTTTGIILNFSSDFICCSTSNPESGTKTYTYDTGTAGDLYQRIAPKPNQTNPATTTVTTTYSYDVLHRLTSKNYNDGTTQGVSFVYDQTSVWGVSPQYPKGRLTLTSTNNGCVGTIFSYDKVGRIANDWQVTPLNCGTDSFPLSFTYDLLGDLSTMYNAREGVTYSYSYDSAARLTRFQSTFIDTYHPGTLLTVNQYNPLGEVQQETLGNGIIRNLSYDHQGRLTSRTDGSVYNFGLGFAPDGNVLTGNRGQIYPGVERRAIRERRANPPGQTKTSTRVFERNHEPHRDHPVAPGTVGKMSALD